MCSNNSYQCSKIAVVSALAIFTFLIGTATVAPISSTAVAGEGGPDKWCGAAACALGTRRGP